MLIVRAGELCQGHCPCAHDLHFHSAVEMMREFWCAASSLAAQSVGELHLKKAREIK